MGLGLHCCVAGFIETHRLQGDLQQHPDGISNQHTPDYHEAFGLSFQLVRPPVCLCLAQLFGSHYKNIRQEIKF